jgi:hypothetical protein
MISRFMPIVHQTRQFHRIYRIKKEEHKYSIIPLSIFVCGMISVSAYRHRHDIIKRKNNFYEQINKKFE